MRKFNVFDGLIYSAISVYSIICLVPMLLVVAVSITKETAIISSGYRLIPEEFSLEAYRLVLGQGTSVSRSYVVTIVVTLTGTLVAVLMTSMAGYTLANKNIRYRDGLALFFFITMVFNTGVVPWYLVSFNLGFHDNLLALIIPGMIFSPFNLFLVRNYMRSIPDSLMESAMIDGAGDFKIAYKIYLPLCLPVLAVVALFYGLAYWNNWWNAIMLINNRSLYPLQYLLFQLQSELQMIADLQQTGGAAVRTLPTESLKMATAVVTIGPIIFMYPYLQKYFIKGLIIGSVKG